MKVRISTARQQTRLDPEFSHEYRDALVEGKRLWVAHGAMRKEFFLHMQSINSLSSILSHPGESSEAVWRVVQPGVNLTYITNFVYYDNRNI
jgi:hypothetical protein